MLSPSALFFILIDSLFFSEAVVQRGEDHDSKSNVFALPLDRSHVLCDVCTLHVASGGQSKERGNFDRVALIGAKRRLVGTETDIWSARTDGSERVYRWKGSMVSQTGMD